MTLAQRLALAFDSAHHTKAKLARAAKVSAASVSDWFSGETKTLKAEPLVRAALYLKVCPLWLVAGEGPMRDAVTNADQLAPPMVAEAAKVYHLPATNWEFPLVDQTRWVRCNPQERGYVQCAMNAALQEVERLRVKPAKAKPTRGPV